MVFGGEPEGFFENGKVLSRAGLPHPGFQFLVESFHQTGRRAAYNSGLLDRLSGFGRHRKRRAGSPAARLSTL
jgi:hypothetical protein